MANTFTVNHQTVCGSWRAVVGTLTMDDGSAGDAANTGFHNIFTAIDNSAVQAKISHTAGAIIACTAASAAVYEVTIFGV